MHSAEERFQVSDAPCRGDLRTQVYTAGVRLRTQVYPTGVRLKTQMSTLKGGM